MGKWAKWYQTGIFNGLNNDIGLVVLDPVIYFYVLLNLSNIKSFFDS